MARPAAAAAVVGSWSMDGGSLAVCQESTVNSGVVDSKVQWTVLDTSRSCGRSENRPGVWNGRQPRPVIGRQRCPLAAGARWQPPPTSARRPFGALESAPSPLDHLGLHSELELWLPLDCRQPPVEGTLKHRGLLPPLPLCPLQTASYHRCPTPPLLSRHSDPDGNMDAGRLAAVNCGRTTANC